MNKRTVVLLVIAASLIVLVAIKLLVQKKVDLVSDATASLNCLIASDAACVLQDMNAKEREKCGWTVESVDFALKQIIDPFWKRQNPNGTIITQLLTYQGIAAQPYLMKNGIPLHREVTNYMDGTKSFYFFTHQLTAVFHGMALEKYGPLPPKTLMNYASLEGVEKFRHMLEARGVTGLAVAEPMRGEVQIVTFDRALANLREAIAKEQLVPPVPLAKSSAIISR